MRTGKGHLCEDLIFVFTTRKLTYNCLIDYLLSANVLVTIIHICTITRY